MKACISVLWTVCTIIKNKRKQNTHALLFGEEEEWGMGENKHTKEELVAYFSFNNKGSVFMLLLTFIKCFSNTYVYDFPLTYTIRKS